MYTKKRKPNWFLYCMVLLTILIVCLYLLIKSEPIKVVVRDNINITDQHLCKDDTSIGQDNHLTAGVFSQVNSYLNQSSSVDAHDNGVFVTDSQQVFGEEYIDDVDDLKLGNFRESEGPITYFELSEHDEYLLAKIVECEAGNQDMIAKQAVAMTVLNRMYDERFPDTIEEVITEHHNGVYQFSPLVPGGSWYYKEPTEASYEAIEDLKYIKSYVEDMYLNFDGLYFESFPQNTNSWHSRNLEFIVTYDDMNFYK